MNHSVVERKNVFSFENFRSMIDGFEHDYAEEINSEHFFGFPLETILHAEEKLLLEDHKSISYFSMEYGLAPSIYNTFQLKRPMDECNQFFQHDVFSNDWLRDYVFKLQIDKMLDIPIYGGGLGVLAGDTIKSAADLGFSFVGLGVLWNKGYFKQNFWYKHGQVPEELTWSPHTYPGLVPLTHKVNISTREGTLYLRLWKYYVYSYDQANVCPLILLDSNLEENPEHFRKLTDQLYRSDDVWWKIFQRAILGIGGMKALKDLGYTVDCYHLNEGHAAFALLERYISLEDPSEMEEAKKKFVYTCHTPVAAGHDRFHANDLSKVLPSKYHEAALNFGKEKEALQEVNLTYLCLEHAHKVNAVAQKHGEIMRLQFPGFQDKVKAITNGVHLHTWLSGSFQKLFDQYHEDFGDWRKDPTNLKNITQLRQNENFRKDLFHAHQENKRNLIESVQRWGLKEDVLTIGWARRICGYKRPALIFHNIEKIIQLAQDFGPLQIIMAGKSHPNDNIGAAHIDEILDHIDQLNQHREVIKVLILENYDTYFGKLLTSSVDVWLNNPLPPFEASGTSGMKAILNGVLQLSTLDGWIVEAAEDNIGWIFGYQHQGPEVGDESNLRLDEDSQALCLALEEVIRLYYQTYQNGEVNSQSSWIDKMMSCVECSAFFNTQRMVQEYYEKMWK